MYMYIVYIGMQGNATMHCLVEGGREREGGGKEREKGREGKEGTGRRVRKGG